MKSALKPNYGILLKSAYNSLTTTYDDYKKALTKCINSTYYIEGKFFYPSHINEMSEKVETLKKEVVRLVLEVERLEKEKEAYATP